MGRKPTQALDLLTTAPAVFDRSPPTVSPRRRDLQRHTQARRCCEADRGVEAELGDLVAQEIVEARLGQADDGSAPSEMT